MKQVLLYTTILLLIISCSKNTDVAKLPPAVSTTSVSDIKATEATSGGNISMEGSVNVTARGIAWSTNTNPTIELPTKTSDGAGPGSFNSTMTGLQPGTTYHVRAYATSSAGTAYGADISFTTVTHTPKLYVCGTEWTNSLGKQQARVWVDGAASILSGNDESFAQGMLVTDAGDVYVAGATKVTQWRATYWKNGTPVYLTDETKEAGAGSVFVNGSDVYACGGERNAAGIFVAKYWKNGTPVLLTDGTLESAGNSIFVSGNDVYVAGYEKNAAGISVAKYWKNGTATTIGTGGAASSMVVSGTDVHIAGTFNASSERGWYWKNGTSTDLDNCSGATSLAVSGNDVYIAGYDGSYNAAYWKNGTRNTLTTDAGGPYTYSIFVANNDIYVAGKTNYNVPCYWLNGQKTSLSASTDWHNKTTGIVYR